MTYGRVIGLDTGPPRERERAWQTELGFEEVTHTARVGFVRNDGETRGAEEILGDGTPKIPQRLDSGVLLALDERFGIQAEQLTGRAEEFRRAVQADRRLQPRAFEALAQHATVFAIQTDVHLGIGQFADILEMRTEWEHHVHLGADTFDQTANLG